MPNKRPIPKVDDRVYASSGVCVIIPSLDKEEVRVSLHHCTVFLDEKEAFQVAISLIQASSKVWGEQFTNNLLTYVEKM
jgi:hypothetical protein